jgi:hypothetical protein
MTKCELEALEKRAEEYGLDLSLIDARLRMTPDERVQAHERAMALATALRRAVEERDARRRDPAASSH